MFDPLVLSSRQTLMQRIADYIRTGYTHWTAGQLPVEHAPKLARKFARLYAVDLDRNRRFRAKQRGEANAVLLLYAGAANSALVRWVLMVTPGDHPAHQLEQLHDATTRNGRMHLCDYELVRLPKSTPKQRTPVEPVCTETPEDAPPHALERVSGRATTVLTWRVREETYDTWRNRALSAARGNNPLAVQQLLTELYRTPGFSGIRRQVGKTVALLRREYRRRHGSMTGLPKLPRLYYVTRLPNRGARLSALVLQHSRGDKRSTDPQPRTTGGSPEAHGSSK